MESLRVVKLRPAGIVRSRMGLINPPIRGESSFTGLCDAGMSTAGSPVLRDFRGDASNTAGDAKKA
jgi:hypothetical protein